MTDDRRSEEWRRDGQGEPLPDWAQADGQWIWRGHLFLYRPRDGERTGGVTMTMALRRTDDTAVPGVDAIRLAEDLGLSVDQLFAHNSGGSLFVAAGKGEPTHGGTTATTYRFRIGAAEAYRTFEEGVPTGRA
jgi:hypothetical protein